MMFPICIWGDNSLDTAKLKAAQTAPGSDDVINMVVDYSTFDALFYKKRTVVVNGTAVKYVSNGKSEKMVSVAGLKSNE